MASDMLSFDSDYSDTNKKELEERATIGSITDLCRIALAMEHMALSIKEVAEQISVGFYGTREVEGAVVVMATALKDLAAAVENLEK